jgi:hypothetical protein
LSTGWKQISPFTLIGVFVVLVLVINLELNSAMNTYIPKKIIRVRPRDKPWINSEIKCKIRKRNRVHKKACQTAHKVQVGVHQEDQVQNLC